MLQKALRRQSRPAIQQLGLAMDAFTDNMSELDTLDVRLEYLATMLEKVSGQGSLGICRHAIDMSSVINNFN